MNPNVERLAAFVREARKRKNLNQLQVRERGGPATGTLGALEAGTLPDIPKPSTLEKLAKGLGVPLNDVLAAAGILPPGSSATPEATDQGEGEVSETRKPWSHHDFSQSSTPEIGPQSNVKRDKELSNSGQQTGISDQATDKMYGRTGGDAGHNVSIPAGLGPMKRLPVYRVSCGERVLINDEPEEWQYWPAMMSADADGTMRVEGESMLGCGYKPGVLIFFQRINGRQPKSGQKVIAEVDGGAVCKLYQKDARGEYLVSAPGDETAFFCHIDETVRLVGIVLGHFTPEQGV